MQDSGTDTAFAVHSKDCGPRSLPRSCIQTRPPSAHRAGCSHRRTAPRSRNSLSGPGASGRYSPTEPTPGDVVLLISGTCLGRERVGPGSAHGKGQRRNAQYQNGGAGGSCRPLPDVKILTVVCLQLAESRGRTRSDCQGTPSVNQGPLSYCNVCTGISVLVPSSPYAQPRRGLETTTFPGGGGEPIFSAAALPGVKPGLKTA